jgi:hypothetical protein
VTFVPMAVSSAEVSNPVSKPASVALVLRLSAALAGIEMEKMRRVLLPALSRRPLPVSVASFIPMTSPLIVRPPSSRLPASFVIDTEQRGERPAHTALATLSWCACASVPDGTSTASDERLSTVTVASPPAPVDARSADATCSAVLPSVAAAERPTSNDAVKESGAKGGDAGGMLGGGQVGGAEGGRCGGEAGGSGGGKGGEKGGGEAGGGCVGGGGTEGVGDAGGGAEGAGLDGKGGRDGGGGGAAHVEQHGAHSGVVDCCAT